MKNGTSNSFPLPNCDKERAEIWGKHDNLIVLFSVLRYTINNDKKSLKIVKLPAPFRYTFDAKACVPIVIVYVEKDKMYIYAVEEGNIVKRLLITSDSKKSNYEIIVETEEVCILLSSTN